MIPTTQQPSDLGRQQAMNGLQLISALASNGMLSLLLDGPKLFPMLVAFLKSPWLSTGVSPIAFAIAYNLCQLNGTRLVPFCDASGLTALQDYVRTALDANPGKESSDAINQKLNLALALLYQIGSPKNGLQDRFINEGGLSLVLDHFNTSKSVLVFLSSFIDLQTPSSVINVIMSHPDFADAVDSMYAENADDSDSDDEDIKGAAPEVIQHRKELSAKTLLVVQVLRNLCLLQGSADTILPLLPRFLGHNLSIADETLSALSNLAATQTIDYRYAWDSSLIGMVISRSAELCEKMIDNAESDVAAATSNRNLPGRKHIMTRVMQILRNEDCIKASSESTSANRPGHDEQEPTASGSKGDNDEEEDDDHDDSSDEDSNASDDDDDDLVFTKDDAVKLIQLAKLNEDLMKANQSWARTISRYIVLLPAQNVWSECDFVEISSSGTVFEKDVDGSVVFNDKEMDLSKSVEGIQLTLPLSIMWRRLSVIPCDKGVLPNASFDTIAQGEIRANAFTVMISGLAKHPVKLATMFKLPSSEQSKWSTGAITVNLFDINSGHPVKVTVDDRVPCYILSRPIGVWTGSTQTWLPLIEKAAAKLLGGYDALSLLTIEQAAVLLTGIQPTKCDLPPTPDQLQSTLESALFSSSILLYTTENDNQSICLVDSINKSSKGSTVAAYNTALFDLRRGWDSTSGHVNTTVSELHGVLTSLYKLNL
jgi:hypothetical protein